MVWDVTDTEVLTDGSVPWSDPKDAEEAIVQVNDCWTLFLMALEVRFPRLKLEKVINASLSAFSRRESLLPEMVMNHFAPGREVAVPWSRICAFPPFRTILSKARQDRVDGDTRESICEWVRHLVVMAQKAGFF